MSWHSQGLETNLDHVPTAGGLGCSGRHVAARRQARARTPGEGPWGSAAGSRLTRLFLGAPPPSADVSAATNLEAPVRSASEEAPNTTARGRLSEGKRLRRTRSP